MDKEESSLSKLLRKYKEDPEIIAFFKEMKEIINKNKKKEEK